MIQGYRRVPSTQRQDTAANRLPIEQGQAESVASQHGIPLSYRTFRLGAGSDIAPAHRLRLRGGQFGYHNRDESGERALSGRHFDRAYDRSLVQYLAKNPDG